MIFKNLTRAKVMTLSFAILIAGLNVPASAAVLNFAQYIDTIAGEKGVQSTFDLGGFTITAHGFNNIIGTGDFNSGPYAYFDGGNAGIGVCQALGLDNLNDGQCNPKNDDNVTGNNNLTEILSISFDQAVRINESYFRNDGHTPNFSANKQIDVSVGAGAFSAETLISTNPLSIGAGLVGSPSYILAAGEAINFKYNNQQFYLSGMDVQAVPIPAAVWLFGSGLMGLLGLTRRKA